MTLALRPYQDEDATWLSQQTFALYLADCRVGKTVTSLLAAGRRGAQRVVVITKAIVREQWRAEAAKWAPGITILVESYDKLARDRNLRQQIANFAPDVLIVDEGQRIKNPTAKRTKSVYGKTCRLDTAGIGHFASAIWVLSGTLMPNHLGEAWTHLAAFDRTRLDAIPFLTRYNQTVDTRYGPMVVGVNRARVPEFLDLLRPVTRRRRFREVFPHVARPRWTEVPLALDAAGRKRLRTVADELAVEAVRRDLARAKTLEEQEEILASAEPHMAALRNALGEIKAPLVAEKVADLLESGEEKVVVFAWHRTTLTALERLLKGFGVARVDGSTPDGKRNAAIKAFRTTKGTRIFLAQIQTANEGIPLHEARVLVFAEYSWSLGDVIQASQRIVSGDRTDQPEIVVPTLQGTIDEDVAKTVVRKAEHASTMNQL